MPAPFSTPALRIDRDEARIRELELLVDQAQLSFGTPNQPRLGIPSKHLYGVFVEQTFTALNSATSFAHNLDLQAPTGKVNVRWLPFMIQHDNTAAGAGDTVTILFVTGDAISANAISLRAFAGGARTVDGTHPLKVTLWFMPADDA